ncbi:MAG: hypothetical protein A2441_00030 [Candidatus Veblenbacteria bacterium RIFOXYC2_FULL_42_11]|uniref:DUF6938 domain-containing protein n=2 Tax=Candidatus Vebleniibacteriota TaxID=1817921 RepID=A0A1G2Q8D5_9BACT|nr:MAG: hypothetical protein A2441_00030 [Candidatus Veblenbacteria bacterium RIFOXYC2_FULL_42_11]
MAKKSKNSKAWIVAVDMGYGHERAAYALNDLAYGGQVLIANKYPGIPKHERDNWKKLRKLYETVSRFKSAPLVGEVVFEVMDRLQQIDLFYPRRDLSRPTMQVRQTYYLIRKGLGKHLIDYCARRPLPLIATYFQAAFAAEEYDYPGDIYCVICDADCSRAWAPINPAISRIKYFAPNGRVAERLKLYGVKPENIYLTGFPLPKELIGGPGGQVIKRDLSRRLQNLDPKNIFRKKYDRNLASYLGKGWQKLDHKHLLTLTFAVGGAGAQKTIGRQIITSLQEKIRQGKIRLNLVTGTHDEAVPYYQETIRNLKLNRHLGKTINICHAASRTEYFKKFSELLHTTDILWTKPSELSFYTGLGLPIIMAPPIGSQEEFNRIWLKTVNGGVTQNDPRYTNEWLFDWVNSGGLARLAWNGFIEAPTHGAYRIESIITGKKVELANLPMIV